METPKQKLRAMVIKLVESSLDDHYSGNGHKERCKNVLAMDAFAHLKDHPKSSDINDFVADLMQNLAKEAWERSRQRVIYIALGEIDHLIEELLTDVEAEEVVAFGSSLTGQKVFRNLDLLRNGILKARNVMTAEVISAWNDPQIADAIDNYIEGLE